MEAMTKNGYSNEFSGAVTAASSVIGPIFPPSIPLIIYGATASVSVAKLFMGGVLPGLLMGVALMILVFIFAVKYRFERHPFNIQSLIKQFFGSILSLITPLIILAGFTTGWFTPTEASSIAVAYSLIIALVVYRTMDWKTFKNCLLESAITSANTLFIIGTSHPVHLRTGKGRRFQDNCRFHPEHQQQPSRYPAHHQHRPFDPGHVHGTRRYFNPDASGAPSHCQGPEHRSGALWRCNGTEPDDGQVTPPFGVCLFVISDIAKIKLDPALINQYYLSSHR